MTKSDRNDVSPEAKIEQNINHLLDELESLPSPGFTEFKLINLVKATLSQPDLSDICRHVANLASPQASLKIIGNGWQKIVFDIGSGKVARIDSTNQRYTKSLDWLHPLNIAKFHSFSVESMWKVAPIERNEFRFLNLRLGRNSYEWTDATVENAGRLPNGQLVVIDGSVTHIDRNLPPEERWPLGTFHYDIVNANGFRGQAAERVEGENSRWLFRINQDAPWRDNPGLSHFFGSPQFTKNVILVPKDYFSESPATDAEFVRATPTLTIATTLPKDLSFRNASFANTSGIA